MAIIVTARPPKRRKGLTPVVRLNEPKAPPTPEEEAAADKRVAEFFERYLAEGREAYARGQAILATEPGGNDGSVVTSRPRGAGVN